jgi:hypothetical protein
MLACPADVRVPQECDSLATALTTVQEGLTSRDFNQRFRTGRIALSSGQQGWAEEREVFPNMTLHLSCAAAARIDGRLCLREGSTGSIRGGALCWMSPVRSPHCLGVPMPHLDEGWPAEEVAAAPLRNVLCVHL